MPLPKPKKKPDDFALLLEAEPVSEEGEEMGGDMGEDDDEFADLEGEDTLPEPGMEEDPLAAESEGPEIDPEQALLCETLGYTAPDEQRALIDLIKLVAPGAAPAPSSAPSTLESGY